MKTTKMLAILVLALGLCGPAKLAGAALGDKTVDIIDMPITYQGRLMDGNEPANGSYDFHFTLYDDPDPNLGVRIPPEMDGLDVPVIDGYFTIELDFGDDPNIFNDEARWLEIGVRPHQELEAIDDGQRIGKYHTLMPRQRITPTPYAITVDNVLGAFMTPEGEPYPFDGLGASPKGRLPGVSATGKLIPTPIEYDPNTGNIITSADNCMKQDLRLIGPNSKIVFRDGTEQMTAAGAGDDGDWTGAGTGSMYPTNITDKIGIGTDLPSRKLEVKAGDEGQIRILGTDRNTYGGIRMEIDQLPLSGGEVGFGGPTNPTEDLRNNLFLQTWGVGLDARCNNSIVFRPCRQTRMIITPTGNVGIGTTNPSAKLEVNGQVKITGGSPGAGKVLTCVDTGGNAEWRPAPAGSTAPGCECRGKANQIAKFTGPNTLTDSIISEDPGSANITIPTRLGVGIAPAAKLHVNGNVRIDGSAENAGGWLNDLRGASYNIESFNVAKWVKINIDGEDYYLPAFKAKAGVTPTPIFDQ